MRPLLLLIIVFLTFLACENEDNGSQNNQMLIPQNIDTIKKLVITSPNTPLYDKVSDGKIITKLDSGALCIVIDKSELKTVDGITDFWYKVKVKNTIGWVFGTETSLKIKQLVTDDELLKNYVLYFISQNNKKAYTDLYNYFVNSNLFVIQKPGAIPIIRKMYYKDGMKELPLIDVEPKIQFNKIPVYDIDKQKWNETGVFVIKSNDKSRILDILELNELIDNQEKTELLQLLDNLRYKVVITQNEGIVLFVSLIDNKLKTICIEIVSNEA